METVHTIQISDARNLSGVENATVDLVVTSPPYPMIKMWDALFSALSEEVEKKLSEDEGDHAFELMHRELDKVWKELFRVTKPGSFVCINIGDATRTVGGAFQLYSNHARIIQGMKEQGFDSLPLILWRKQTNAPNKFMGSGMLPAGAYVTLEHEYILIFRKQNKRLFPQDEDKQKRTESAFFWEERNQWFSDLWDFKGASQILKSKELRERSAAFPFELAYRLINMYSLQEDTVLDPFLGTGTTAHAAIASGRNSIGIEIDENFSEYIFGNTEGIQRAANNRVYQRIENHNKFIDEYIQKKGHPKHVNKNHLFPVITKQESQLRLQKVNEIQKKDHLAVKAVYEPLSELGAGGSVEKIQVPSQENPQIDLF